MHNRNAGAAKAIIVILLLLCVALGAAYYVFEMVGPPEDRLLKKMESLSKANLAEREPHAKALVELKSRAAIEKALAHPDPNVRYSVVMALKYWKDPVSVELLCGCLDDKVSFVRNGAVVTLGLLEDDAAVDRLIAGMEKADDAAKNVYADTLNKITGQDHGPDPAAWKKWREEGP